MIIISIVPRSTMKASFALENCSEKQPKDRRTLISGIKGGSFIVKSAGGCRGGTSLASSGPEF